MLNHANTKTLCGAMCFWQQQHAAYFKPCRDGEQSFFLKKVFLSLKSPCKPMDSHTVEWRLLPGNSACYESYVYICPNLAAIELVQLQAYKQLPHP